MIFETEKFNFESNQTVKLSFTNDYAIVVDCRNDHCTIKAGYDGNYTDVSHSSLDDAEKNVVNLIQTNVKPDGARLISFARSKNKKSEYQSIMEKYI